MRLQVQSDRTLKAVDFFAPFDSAQLHEFDSDFGSGGVVGLPDAYFGTSLLPHLALAIGKQGYVYLLNRDGLGGSTGVRVGETTSSSDSARTAASGVARACGRATAATCTSRPPAAGPAVVSSMSTTGLGSPSLAQVARSSDVFGFGSGSPVITSDATASGSALVWIIWAANRQGSGGQLRAYDPVPVNAQPVLRWSASIGTATNYSTPGVGAGRLYVGTRDGHVLGFGSPVTQPLSGSVLSFPRTTTGTSSAPQTLTMTANRNLTVAQPGWAAPASSTRRRWPA